jgi:hypothetical protein
VNARPRAFYRSPISARAIDALGKDARIFFPGNAGTATTPGKKESLPKEAFRYCSCSEVDQLAAPTTSCEIVVQVGGVPVGLAPSMTMLVIGASVTKPRKVEPLAV